MSSVKSTTSSEVKSRSQPVWIYFYNLVSSISWAGVFFFNVFPGILINQQPDLFKNTYKYLIGVQSLAIVEIYNSAVGNVRAPLFTTIAQVFSRLLIVVGIFTVLPNSPPNYKWYYVTLSTAWSITEIVRYSYYAINIKSNGSPPTFLTFLRYNLFLVLYPMGISSECLIIYNSLTDATSNIHLLYAWFLKICLATYIPGSYILYTYMLKQRKKVMKKIAVEYSKKKF
ncbi:enoyl-CoA hydratase PHS1 [Ascoidea rubescens DSM 1968]|uniref:Very-long-chain (3R)-3-hydroxyacyl-CoA dehydratase n=1 Tax=Ascoidea rubescens DSM 1968 TaxID=1344418 RepID=A0A1D2VJ36_9ASCO|nr:3-hydroxyacyl-CoA dehydratase [Ascoidea rubescens DSM 1968]ODV61644.1 3-hydroxyacyl-CoA dehydratase [Ascoidea rubescens DSM 1968]